MMESTPAFVDGLGRRVVRRLKRDVAPTEHLVLDPILAAHAGFVGALRDRVAKVQAMRLSSVARALQVDDEPGGGIVLVSEHVVGWRLADLLDVAESENLTLDIGVVMLLVRQLLPSAALLSTQSRDVASGALGPEHLLLTPHGRVVLAEYVFGPAIGTLGWPPDRLWRALRVATPPDGEAGAAISHRGDVTQLGITVLSLVVGRRLRDDEFPERLDGLVAAARQRTPTLVDAPLSTGFRSWLLRALQCDAKPFATLFDAQRALEQLLATEADLIAKPSELDLAMARLARFMPKFELPGPPADLVPLPELAARADDWAPTPPAEWDMTATTRVSAAAMVLPRPRLADVVAPIDLLASATSDVLETIGTDLEPAAASLDVRQDDIDGRHMGSGPSLCSDAPPAWSPVPLGSAAPRSPWWRSPAAMAVLAVLTVSQAVVLGVLWNTPSDALGRDGELVVTSRPEGAQVVVDDELRGHTPLSMKIRPGTHVMQLRVDQAEPRVIPLTIRPGVQTAQYVELQGVSSAGILEVRTEPLQARVTIDGEARGSTPVTIRDVAPGDHHVVLERAGWRSTQVVRVERGVTAQLMVPIR